MDRRNQTKFKETEIGTIPEEWDVVRLNNIAGKIGIGPFGSSIKVETFVDNGIPVISGQHLKGIKLDDNKYNFVSKIHAEKLHSANVFRGDVIFTHAGNIGQVAYIPENSQFEKYVISQRQFYLRCNKERLLPEFITYFFKTPIGQYKLLSNKAQTGVPSISQPVTHLRNIEVPLPPIREQKRIAEILGALDEKIELNRRMNENLEKIASAIFKHWFVDFASPAVALENEAISPIEFINSELGKIPKGWTVKKLSEIADITIGRTPPRLQKNWFSKNNSDIKWISIRDLGNKNVYISETAEYLTREAVKKFNIPIISKDTVVISFKLTVGRVAITTEDMLSNEAIAHINVNNNIATEFLYLLLNKFDYSSLGTTSSIANATNSQTIKQIKIIVPPEKIMNEFSNIVKPLFRQIYTNTKQINNLSQIRDSLLPRLMSGKIRA